MLGARQGLAGHAAGVLGARGRGARGARHGHWARGLGVLLDCGLCTLCTQPVFDPV